MSLISNSCIEYNEYRKICVAEQNGKIYTLNNLSSYKVKKIKVDKCIPQKIRERRCDYLLHAIKDKQAKAFFIELKGGATVDAVKQLHDTIVYLKDEFNNCQINARIVGTKDSPEIASSPHYKKLAKKILGTNGTIKRATNKAFTENI